MSRADDLRMTIDGAEDNLGCIEADLAIAEEEGDDDAADGLALEMDNIQCYISDLQVELEELEDAV